MAYAKTFTKQGETYVKTFNNYSIIYKITALRHGKKTIQGVETEYY